MVKVTLTDCRVALFQMINSSERLIIQRIGRAMRHKKPIIILPYYIDTREAEIVHKIIEGYNEKLIHNVLNINDIKL